MALEFLWPLGEAFVGLCANVKNYVGQNKYIINNMKFQHKKKTVKFILLKYQISESWYA